MLTNYFTPDLSAGSFRMQALIDALAKYKNTGLRVDIVTTFPNRYASFKTKPPLFEDKGWLRIYRIKVPAHKNGMIDQAIGYYFYYKGVKKIVNLNSYHLVFATSSRLMTGFLASRVARKLQVPYYLDLRDLFADTITQVLNKYLGFFLAFFIKKIEKNTLEKAHSISIVSEGFMEYVNEISPNAKIKVFTNGIDDLFYEKR